MIKSPMKPAHSLECRTGRVVAATQNRLHWALAEVVGLIHFLLTFLPTGDPQPFGGCKLLSLL